MSKYGLSRYEELVRRSVDDIEWFWKAALEDLGFEWYRPYEKILDDSRGMPWCMWFCGGKLNMMHNCLDRHASRQPHKTALVWEGDSGETREVSYSELAAQVCRIANALRAGGFGVGDAVGFYMPMVPEMVAALFAVLKIGAVAVPVFSAFGADALAVRLRDAGAKVLFTADGCFRRGRSLPIKERADEALLSVPSVIRTVVLRRTGARVEWVDGRDVWLDDFVSDCSSEANTEVLDSEARCLLVYTSGTTGNPKGTIHTHAGALAQVAKELAYYFDVKSTDRFFWLTDIGWMMGPWQILGSTFLGATCVIFEGAPDWPQPDRLWELVDRYRLTHLGISPTAVRVLLRAGDDWVARHDLSSLRILGSTGEPWDDESYMWFFRRVGRERCPVINISGGTEVMGCLLASAPVSPIKGCSFQGPGLGMDADIVGEDGLPVRGALGYLVLRKPAPSMTRGFLNDPARYLDTYFSRWPGLWFHGDWGLVDQDRFWFISGRADDTIKVAGKRVGPAEVEAALMAGGSVSEAAAIGIPDAVKGEAIACFVVLKPGIVAGNALAQSLAEQVAKSLGKTMRPKCVHFVRALPKTRSAKIIRGAIKRRYLGQAPGDISSIESTDALEEIPRRPRE